MKRLRIGVDARELLGATTGVGRYLGELMTRWTARPDADRREFLLYSPAPLSVAWPGVSNRVLPGGAGTWWEQTKLGRAIRRDAPDVFFAPAYTAPLGLGMPFAVTIHDVSFTRHPEWFRWRERHRRNLLTRSAARRAGAVITVSEFSRREIAELYAVPPARITVVYNGLTPRPSASVQRERLVLYAGSIFNRRRVPDLLTGFAQALPSVPSAKLVIVGDNRTWPPQDLLAIAAALGLRESVEVRNYVSDDELDALYRRASAFAFLSEYEGFGLTPLEALSAGLPVLVLDTPVAREIYGDAAVFVPSGDIGAIADALVRLLASDAAGERRAARALPVLARYSWDASAEQTLAVIEGLVGR